MSLKSNLDYYFIIMITLINLYEVSIFFSNCWYSLPASSIHLSLSDPPRTNPNRNQSIMSNFPKAYSILQWLISLCRKLHTNPILILIDCPFGWSSRIVTRNLSLSDFHTLWNRDWVKSTILGETRQVQWGVHHRNWEFILLLFTVV